MPQLTITRPTSVVGVKRRSFQAEPPNSHTSKLFIPQTLKDYGIDEKNPKSDRLDEDQLESLRLELHKITSSLLKADTRIISLHDEWTTLQQSSPRETEQFDEYITKYGDYRTSITQAVTQLEELDLLLNKVDNEFRGRDLSVSSDSSENPVSCQQISCQEQPTR
ncbi:hypothetical protein RB195_013044 [Necator americanus]|uniref:Uncharacterized protein n=1 Tax=Necator americanus TaxID=51031 RepID=A0ABR1DTZ5_NECAM